MATGEGVSGKALAVAMVGVVFAYSAIKGKKLSTTIRDLIYGKNPSDNPTTELAVDQGQLTQLLNPAGAGTPGTTKPGTADDPITAGAAGKNKQMTQLLAQPLGWSAGAEWDALVKIIDSESGFKNTAQNPTSTAYGIFQFLDSTWAGTGYAKTSDPHTQILAGLIYIKKRYGDPINAWNFHLAHGWY